MKTNDGATRVLIFSSNSFVRVGLRQTFEAHSGTTITGEATSSMAARELLEQGRPDLVVLDVSSDMKLTDILGRVRQAVPRARIFLLVVSADNGPGPTRVGPRRRRDHDEISTRLYPVGHH